MRNQQRLRINSLFGISCAKLWKYSRGSIFSPAQGKTLSRSEQGEVCDVTLEAMDVPLKYNSKPERSYNIYCVIQIKYHWCS